MTRVPGILGCAPMSRWCTVMACLALAGSLAGWPAPAPAQEAPAPSDIAPAASTTTENEGTRARSILFGGDEDFYPYEWRDKDGLPHGFNIDLVRALGEVLGCEVRIELDRWDRIRHGVEVERRIDLSDMYHSEARARVVDFAEPFAVVWEQAYVRKGGPEISGLEDLRGLHVLVHRTGYIDEYLEAWDPTLTRIPVSSEITALRELAEGRGDVALVAQIVGRLTQELPGLETLRTSGPPLLPRPYGLVVRKGDAALLADINRGMEILRTTGRLQAIEDRWFGSREEPGALTRFIARNLPWMLAIVSGLLALGWALSLLLGRKVARQARELRVELEERRKAEEALKQSREQFRLAFQNSPSILGISDLLTGEYLDVNGAFEKVLGYTREETLGRSSTEMNIWVDERDRIRTKEELDSRGMVRDQEIRLRRKDGTIIRALVAADLIHLGGRPCLLTNVLDISDRARWEQALRDSEERWKFALEGAGEGVWDWDVANERMFVSRRFKEILGYPDEAFDYLPMPLTQHVPVEDFDRLEREFQEYLAGRRSVFQTEIRMRGRDDEFRWVNVRGRAVGKDEKGLPHRVIGTILDVTDRRRADEERASLEEQLRQSQKMEVVGQLAGGIAHDFNNQLMVIRGYCDLLQGQGLDARSLALLNEVVRASDRAATMTGRLLAFGRKQVRRLSVFNPNRVLADMTGALNMMAGESITLAYEAAPNLGCVRADREQVEQVVANIVVNARDAMPGGGRLTIRTRNIVLDEEYVRHNVGARMGPHVMMSFQDSGIGMDAAIAARIFEPFFTTKQEGLGSGLGLSIVYGIVKQSGGHVTVESEPGRGSVFKVYLPRVEEEPSEDHAAPSGLVQRTRPATVLFVEDDPNLFSLLRGVLETAGYHVLAAPVPEQALDLANAHEGTIDLLVTDVVMPGLSGPVVAERLQAKRPGLRILFISGYPKDVLERQTVLPPGIRLLGKPFSPRELLATIQKVLDAPPPMLDHPVPPDAA